MRVERNSYAIGLHIDTANTMITTVGLVKAFQINRVHAELRFLFVMRHGTYDMKAIETLEL